MLQLILAFAALILPVSAQTGIPVVDLTQINRDFHTACRAGDTDAAAALLLQGVELQQSQEKLPSHMSDSFSPQKFS